MNKVMELVAFIFEHPSYAHAFLKAPTKNASEIEVCLNHLLSIFVTLVTNVSVETSSGPRSDCFYRSSLIWFQASETFQKMTKADDF